MRCVDGVMMWMRCAMSMMSVCAGLGVGRMLGRIPELTLGRGDTAQNLSPPSQNLSRRNQKGEKPLEREASRVEAFTPLSTHLLI